MPFSRSRSPESMTRSATLLVRGEGAGLPEHRVDQRGLAVVDVRDDRDVAQVGAVPGSRAWRGSLRFRSGIRGPSYTKETGRWERAESTGRGRSTRIATVGGWPTSPPSSPTPRRVVAFTGAGISTESGIPDFRSPGGVWTRFDPADFTFGRYVESAAGPRAVLADAARVLRATRSAPNAAHLALARLEAAGRSLGVVTQNIDGLHQQAGSRTGRRAARDRARGDVHRARPAARHARGLRLQRRRSPGRSSGVDAGDPDPLCPHCGGLVKSSTVSFEQVLFPASSRRRYDLAAQADLLLAIGVVAAGLPGRRAARGRGAPTAPGW